ncbi:MAG TPA: hypothetical protein VGP70_00895 [Actinomadura sp.]|jgi:hypothetical protein|nr:hypothetical protein [Actinomadura sp.]
MGDLADARARVRPALVAGLLIAAAGLLPAGAIIGFAGRLRGMAREEPEPSPSPALPTDGLGDPGVLGRDRPATPHRS